MTGWLPADAEQLFGAGASAEESYGVLTVDVPRETWTAALRTARTTLGCTFFDWLSAVDEPGDTFSVCAHLVAPGGPPRRLLLRTAVPRGEPVLASAAGEYAGADWHERETHEMFGIAFDGHPGLAPLLLPDGFEGHPLRKDFVLAARVVKAWPGAKEPGESGHGGPRRRQMQPPGVPDPNEWGPLKGTLPPAPARPARARAGAPAATPGERPARPARPRRARSASDGSASQRGPERPERQPEGDGAAARPPGPGTRPGDAPWHQTRPGEDRAGADRPGDEETGSGGEARSGGEGEARSGDEGEARPGGDGETRPGGDGEARPGGDEATGSGGDASGGRE
ncbi:NADH-quinone oxidoreductase subunit C [Streptomyces sp. NPDC050560]|uniref:NADH-quinone oxidoreductase subunit C n=1 Tax=Streptomyces sp. NPDC050560 TaxID=3365630 RepID=UPI00378FA1B2